MRSLVESFPDHLAARLPAVRAKHQALGLTDEESWATLRDVFRAHEVRGEEPFSDVGWVEIVFSGRLAELGRLQFEKREDGVLAVHIPESGRLTPAACDASFARAREIFRDCHTASCHSWLLDPALRKILSRPRDSNIVRFQQRFELLPGRRPEANADVLRFVFHTLDPDLAKVSAVTEFEWALLEHMRAGRSWHAPTGLTSSW